ncbi:MAG TPA: MFS transporter [Longimicrobiales bacterium]
MTNGDARARRRILGLLFLGVLMGALDIAIIGPALPAIREAFGVDERAAAWTLTVFVLFNLIGTPLMAKLSDARGRRPIYVLAVAVFAAGSLGVALARSFPLLIVGRAVQGFGAGGIFPVASAVIGDIFPVEKRGRALGLIGAVFGIAFLIGPILGGVLLMFGWPLLFLVNLPIAALVIFGALRLLPATRAERERALDAPGMLLLSALLFALAFGLNRLDAASVAASLASPGVWPFLAAALVLAPVFWLRERRAADPLLRPGLFRARQVAIASAIALGAGLSEASIVFVPALLVAAFGVTTSRASFMLVPVVLALAVGAPVSGRMLDRFGSRVVIAAGTALAGAGMLAVGVARPTLATFYAAGIVIGLGLAALVGSSLRYVLLNEAPPAERGSAQGVLTLFTSIGRLVGAALVGALVASHGGGLDGYALAFRVVGGAMLVLTALSLGLKARGDELATVARHVAGAEAREAPAADAATAGAR